MIMQILLNKLANARQTDVFLFFLVQAPCVGYYIAFANYKFYRNEVIMGKQPFFFVEKEKESF